MRYKLLALGLLIFACGCSSPFNRVMGTIDCMDNISNLVITAYHNGTATLIFNNATDGDAVFAVYADGYFKNLLVQFDIGDFGVHNYITEDDILPYEGLDCIWNVTWEKDLKLFD